MSGSGRPRSKSGRIKHERLSSCCDTEYRFKGEPPLTNEETVLLAALSGAAEGYGAVPAETVGGEVPGAHQLDLTACGADALGDVTRHSLRVAGPAPEYDCDFVRAEHSFVYCY